MKLVFPSTTTLFAVAIATGHFCMVLSQDDQCAENWICRPTSTTPTLDADHSEWTDVEAYTTTLLNTLGEEYTAGAATYKCQYDSEHIYFALEIPGEYRFNTTDNHHCAAIGTMFKVGSKASYINMGGCPDSFQGCDEGVPETCADYLVDIGAHWELKTTEQNTLYGVAASASASASRQNTDGTPPGDDPIANLDDEYGVSAWCRKDDDTEDSGNEWSGAWMHTNPVEGEFGTYHFELSRKLKTSSPTTDAQLTPGETAQFGIAFWDPYEEEEMGWSDIGHYLTGCSSKWINLELATEDAEATDPPSNSIQHTPGLAIASAISSLLAFFVM